MMEQQTDEIVDTAIRIARVWGIMETLDDFPSMMHWPTKDERTNIRVVRSWAVECVDMENIQLVEYLKNKLNGG